MTARLVILSHNDPTYRHVISERPSAKALERTEDGVNVNLDHANYYTKIEETEEAI